MTSPTDPTDPIDPVDSTEPADPFPDRPAPSELSASKTPPPSGQPPGEPGASAPPPPSHRASPDTAEDWEQVRRSIAMLSTGAWAMKREQALVALDSLVQALRWRQDHSTCD